VTTPRCLDNLRFDPTLLYKVCIAVSIISNPALSTAQLVALFDPAEQSCRGGCDPCREITRGVWQQDCITATCIRRTQACTPSVACSLCSVDESSTPAHCSQDCLDVGALNPMHFRRVCTSCLPFDLVPRSPDDDLLPGVAVNPRWDYLNGIPKNPRWAYEIETGNLPDARVQCRQAIDEEAEDPANWYSGSSACTQDRVTTDSDLTCGPHVNWRAALYEGVLKWSSWSGPLSDDDYRSGPGHHSPEWDRRTSRCNLSCRQRRRCR
jgi:hypothetical protein